MKVGLNPCSGGPDQGREMAMRKEYKTCQR